VTPLLLLLALSAPTPRAKPAVRPPLCGTWLLAWGTLPAEPAVFSADGSLRYRWCGHDCEGGWELKGDVLTIFSREVGLPRGEPYYAWEVRLEKGRWKGKTVNWNGGLFALKRPR
jgi:hypothetical protein